MLEAMLSGRKTGIGNITPGNFNDENTLLYMTMEDVVDRSIKANSMVLGGTGLVNQTTQSKDGSPTFFTGLGGWITPSNMSLLSEIGTGDYTIEFDYYNSNLATGYKNLFYTNFMTIRWGDNGFGNRLQFGASMASVAVVYSTQYTWATLGSKWVRITIQRKDSTVRLWIDGILQTVRNNNYAGAAVTGFSNATAVGTLTYFKLGRDANTQAANEGAYFDNFEISKVARY